MKNSRTLGLILIALAASVWLLPSFTAHAQGGPPPIPHPLDSAHQDCVVCHSTGVGGAPKFPPDHTGRTNDMCQLCHKPGAATPSRATTVPTKAPAPGATPAAQPTGAAGGPPKIPHPLQNRDNCLACHQTGVGGAPKVPADHAGRTNDLCKGCHQPAAAAEPPVVVPTTIPHKSAATAAQDACVTCHNTQSGATGQVAKDWATSIHAERGVSCVNCHGGDATKSDKSAAHAVSAGFVGVPKVVDIPALCASCHSNIETMRPYDLPTDQYAKYLTSIHGQKLAQGDTKVATCATCHGSHGTQKIDDPTAKVYPFNVPALCASCHANVDYMKPYGIPTNQYELYIKSVHGQALLVKQDTRAPSCATCHGTHGAAPPGFSEVANVCGSCHSATQQYYLQSVHSNNQPGTPKCVTCHGRYDVMPATDSMFVDTGTRGCSSCHPAGSPPAAAVKSLYDQITGAATAVDHADAAIKRAAQAALIVAPEEAKLAEANTSLITARAAQHTLNAATVKEKTDNAVKISQGIIDDAAKAASDEIFRRQVMVIGLVIMGLAILSLYVIRRELYKQLPPE